MFGRKHKAIMSALRAIEDELDGLHSRVAQLECDIGELDELHADVERHERRLDDIETG